MPKRTYVGDNAAVILRLPDGSVEVARGETVDVSVEVAAELDLSAAWSKKEHTKQDDAPKGGDS